MRACAVVLAASACLAGGAPLRAQEFEVPNPQQAAEAIKHYRAGEELMRLETFEQAAAEFQVAIRLDPTLMMAHYSLGQAYMALKRYPDAVKAFLGCRDAVAAFDAWRQKDAAAADRRLDDELRELKESLAAVQGGRVKTSTPAHDTLRLEERVRALEDQRNRDKNHRGGIPAEISLALGSAYLRSGQLPEAEKAYGDAIGANPKLGAAHNNLAFAYMKTGRYDEAEKELKLAEKNGYPVVPQFKEDLKKAKAAAKP